MSTTIAVCPLCRQPSPEIKGDPTASRLCEKCRAMVDSIRPTNAPAGAQQPNPAGAARPPQSTPQGTPLSGQPRQTLAGPPYPAEQQTPGRQQYQGNPAPPMATQPSMPAAQPPIATQPAMPAQQSMPGQPFVVPQRPLTPPPQRAQSGDLNPVGTKDFAFAPPPPASEAQKPPSGQPLQAAGQRPPLGVPSPHLNNGLGSEAESEQWPLMVEASQESSRGFNFKLWGLLLLLLVVGGSAAFYFGLKKGSLSSLLPSRGSSANQVAQAKRPTGQEPVTRPPSNQAGQAQVQTPGQAQNPAPGDSAGQSKPAIPAASISPVAQKTATGPSTQPSPAAAATKQPEPKQPEKLAPPDTNSGTGSISFQMASFPQQGLADEFCQKLKNAGIPAYVVAADIPHRGRWFRVRAGRFASANEAQQAASGWRGRASKAGISLQLVQCDYQTP